MLKVLSAISLAFAAASNPLAGLELDLEREFTQWMADFEKIYEPVDLFYRFRVYKANKKLIDEHNAQGHSYTLAPNQFMDLDQDEFKKIHLNGLVERGSSYRAEGLGKTSCTQGNFKAPTAQSVDWTAKGMVSAVKNQGSCGSCWAFSTTGSIEAHTAIKSGKAPVSISEQQLVDCSSSYGNNGCGGGLMDFGFEYLADNGGSCTEEAYPYTASQGTCQSTCQKVTQITGCQDVPKDPEQLKGAIEQTGPVSIAIQANQLAFQFYHGGVLSGNCGTQLDHGVLVVGYDDTAEMPYWKVKNSWGATWGESGYVRIEIAGDKCGVTQSASIPLV